MKSEILKQIDGYPEYWVSSIGNVYSTMKGGFKKLKPLNDSYGYFMVNLCKCRKHKLFKIHRLVAQAFILNPLNLPCVNHKDEDKTNNTVENLEWCTYEYNLNYGTRNERSAKTRSKTVYQYTLDGTFIREWISVSEIQRQTGWNQGNISACCRGERKTAHGYRWSYTKV